MRRRAEDKDEHERIPRSQQVFANIVGEYTLVHLDTAVAVAVAHRAEVNVRVPHMGCSGIGWRSAVLPSKVPIVLHIGVVDMPARMAVEVRQEVSEEVEGR